MRLHALFIPALTAWLSLNSPAAADQQAQITGIIQPLMAKYGIPGMAVGVLTDSRDNVFFFGVESKATEMPVGDYTLFEIGSVSKTFTASLAAYAQAMGCLSLQAPVSTYLPALRGTAFDNVTLVELASHTQGGMPLQVPDGINNDAQMMAYFKAWKPAYPPGTMRTYGNPNIGLLGLATAATSRQDFTALEQTTLIAPLGLSQTFLTVPPPERPHYAQGYTDSDTPIRMNEGELGPETYGVRLTAGNLLRYIAETMGLVPLPRKLQEALIATHTGYYRIAAGGMVQDLVWEQYPANVSLKNLLAGNSANVLLQPNPATAIIPPLPPQQHVLIDKTGSTAGFSTYVLFIPARHIGIVLLANKSFPIPARVTAAYEILQGLEK